MGGHATLTHTQLPPDRIWVLVVRRFVVVLLALGVLVAVVRTALPPPPPPPSGIVGYGAATVGGRGGTVLHPVSLAALRSALNASGPRLIALPTSRQTWDLAGNDLMLNKPYVTLDGGAIIFKGGAVKVTASQVIVQNLTSHAGDQAGNPADVDALTVNGNSACIDHIVLSHVEGLWGPDVGGLAVLGCVHDLTVQYSILGEGLLRSRHPGSSASNGHAMALNIADNYGNPANRVTVYGNLLDHRRRAQPAPGGGDLHRPHRQRVLQLLRGPVRQPAQRQPDRQHLPARPGAGRGGAAASARSSGATPRTSTSSRPSSRARPGPPATGRWASASPPPAGTTPSCAVPARPARRRSPARARAAAYASVLSLAGPAIRSDQTARLLANVAHGTGTYYSGKRGPEPRPSWP